MKRSYLVKLSTPRNFPRILFLIDLPEQKLSGLFNQQTLGENPIKTEYLTRNSKLEADINRIN